MRLKSLLLGQFFLSSLISNNTLINKDIKDIENNINLKEEFNNSVFDSSLNVVNTQSNSNEVIASLDELPSSYYLMDDYALFAQDQSYQGLCWNFATMMALSTTIMKATGEYLEFSDSWVSTVKSTFDSSYKPGAGGFESYTLNVEKNYGLVLEQDFPYDSSFFLTKENASQFYARYSRYSNKNFLDNIKSVNFSFSNFKKRGTDSSKEVEKQIKNHILNHGSITASLSWQNYFYETKNNTKYTVKVPNETSGGHAVTIIGWDDEFETSYNGVDYKGAFIAMNSFSNEGKANNINGCVYLLYDDTSYWGSSYGFKYVENYRNEDFYFHSKIRQSNAKFESYLKNFYHYPYKQETFITKQKNIFQRQKDVDITYSYKKSSDAYIKSIKVYKNDVDITNNFIISEDAINENYRIIGENLDIGSYKVIVTFTNNTITEENINAFYLLDGTEINKINLNIKDQDGNYAYGEVENNGFERFYNNFNYVPDRFTYGTSLETGVLPLKLVFATNHDVSSITTNMATSYYQKNSNENYLIARIKFDLKKEKEYHIKIKSRSGVERDFIVTILLKPSKYSKLAYVIYDGAGEDNIKNLNNRVFVSINTNCPTDISSPYKRYYSTTYWYTDPSYSEESRLKINEEKKYSYLNYNNLIDNDTDTVYWSGRYQQSYKDSVMCFLYAKYAELNKASICTITSLTNTNSLLNMGAKIEVKLDQNIYAIKDVDVKWYINGVVCQKGSSTLKRTFNNPGTYTIKCSIDGIESQEITYTVVNKFDTFRDNFSNNYAPYIFVILLALFLLLKTRLTPLYVNVETKNRNGILEFYRFISALFILGYHDNLHPSIDEAMFENGRVVTYFFFIISGYYLSKTISKYDNIPLKKAIGKFIIDFIKKLGIPLLISYICCLISVGYPFKEFFFPSLKYLWFIHMTLIYELIALIIRRKNKNENSKLGITIIIMVIASLYKLLKLRLNFNSPLDALHEINAFIYIPFGYLLSKIQIKFKSPKWIRIIISLTLFTYTCYYILSNKVMFDMYQEFFVGFFLIPLFTIIIIDVKYNNKVFTLLGDSALVIYVYQMINYALYEIRNIDRGFWVDAVNYDDILFRFYVIAISTTLTMLIKNIKIKKRISTN